MLNYIDLPIEFQGLQGRVQWVTKINDNEYHSSCPRCGINGNHADGSPYTDQNPSDRFIMWLSSRNTGLPFGICFRGCGFKWTPNKEDTHWTDEERQVFKEKQNELQERENERVKKYALEVVMKHNLHLKYIDNLKNSTYGQNYLKKRGFNSEYWNNYFGFGIWEDYKCRGFLDTYYAPAITMPIAFLDRVVENIKLRVTEPHHTKDRFRNLYKTGAQHVYLPMKGDHIMNKVAIIEGEMKSCTVAMRGNLPNDVQIIASQGNGIGTRMLHAIRNCEVVYLILDPDTFTPNDNGVTNIMTNAKRIGYDRVQIVPTKQKVDDAILQGYNLRNAFNMAVKPERLGLKIL